MKVKQVQKIRDFSIRNYEVLRKFKIYNEKLGRLKILYYKNLKKN